ncbi:hypothetical protein Y032_0054g2524 [Ancylostoma ceylanicum]|uniref:Uncharacterized protein n=1 Tax=Ancylostoma ceylanicum TaxID=53326 RepID=A0A016U6E0_9BILA|nr:hypothetical protein Y032_0054g2524 [Ancylostoma ceylanicum]
MQQRKNSYHVGPRAQAVEHGSYLCKIACVPRDTLCQKRKVANVLKYSFSLFKFGAQACAQIFEKIFVSVAMFYI